MPARETLTTRATISSDAEEHPLWQEEQLHLPGGSVPATHDRRIRSNRATDEAPFWNRNVAASDWTVECPPFLTYALENEKDRAILNMPDEEYTRQTWGEIRGLILENRLDLFTRVPSELRLYREYCHQLIEQYGSIMTFVLDERLHWARTATSREPFSSSDDYKILFNDWPYGVDERIVHLVVWTRFELPADPTSEIGDMTPATRMMVDEFVRRTFVSECGQESVIWFKNWNSLKSVHAVEHFHVMLFDPDPGFVRTVTHGDVPLFMKAKSANGKRAT